MKEAQNRYKSYIDKRRRPLEFEVGDHVFLKVYTTKGVVRFSTKRKLDQDTVHMKFRRKLDQ